MHSSCCSRIDSSIRESIKYEKFTDVEYTLKDGTIKKKKDFVLATATSADFIRECKEYWPSFIAHHNYAKWLDADFVNVRKQLPRGTASIVIDYAENYTHKPPTEIQSKYFSQVNPL